MNLAPSVSLEPKSITAKTATEITFQGVQDGDKAAIELVTSVLCVHARITYIYIGLYAHIYDVIYSLCIVLCISICHIRMYIIYLSP